MENILIILTSTVNINPNKLFLFQTNPVERAECYIKAVKQWLDKTNLRICLVENSDYNYPELTDYLIKYENRFELLVFNELTHPPDLQHYIYNNSKGASELYAINYAYNNSKFKNSTQFIIKITARYFVDAFETFLINSNIHTRCKNAGIIDSPDMIVALRQHHPARCEIVGCNISFIPNIFCMGMSDDDGNFYPHVESLYQNRILLLNPKKVLICDEFIIEYTQRGGEYGSFISL